MTHTSTEQPEALRLAYELEAEHGSETLDDAADMLRRQHARILELEAAQAQRVMRPRDCQRPECMSRGCFGHCMNEFASAMTFATEAEARAYAERTGDIVIAPRK